MCCIWNPNFRNYIAKLFNVHHSHYHIVDVFSKDTIIFYKVTLCAIVFGLVSKLFAEFTHFFKVFVDKIHNTSIKSFIGGIIIIILILLIQNRMYLGLSLKLLSQAFETPVVPYAFIIKLLLIAITLSTGFQ